MPRLFILFNHTLTKEQEEQASSLFGVSEFVPPPPEVAALWRQLPADAQHLSPLLQPVLDWLTAAADPGDFVLIYGDFGACYLVVSFAMRQGLLPVYSTTERHAVEERLDDGSVHMVHRFRHVRFRLYGE